MEFKQIEAFVNVIKYKSFSKAADASFLTQPTISAHISSLEKELGVILVDRSGKESRPTKQGRAFYHYAINMIHTREKALEAVGGVNQSMGVIDLRASSIPGQYIVPALMCEFKKKYPEVKFYMEQTDSETVWKNIVDSEGELGFTGDYLNHALGCEILFREPSVLITPKTEKFRRLREKSEKISYIDFIDEPFIWREEGSATRSTFENQLALRGMDGRMKVAATVNNLEAVKQCVAGGMGISVVSQVVVKEREEDFYIFQFDDLYLEREFYLVYNQNTTLSPAASKFKDFVIEFFTRP